MNNRQSQTIPTIALGLSVFALIIALYASRHTIKQLQETPTGRNTTAFNASLDNSLERIRKTGIIKVGYGGYPPYSIINLSENDPNKRVSGFSVDLIKEIATRQVPPLKVEWQFFNWDTLKTDLEGGRFDVIIEPIFQTIPRAMDFGLCRPYSFLGIAAGVVLKDDNRFKAYYDLDRPDITIALAKGWTSSEFATRTLTKPKFSTIPVGDTAYQQCDEVLLGRADIALNDVPTVLQYVKAHQDKVKALWLDSPPSSVPGGFLLRKTDRDLRDFLDSSITILKADGVLDALDKKWNSLGYLEHSLLIPGAGLRDAQK